MRVVTADLGNIRIGHFHRLFRQLDSVLPRAIRSADRGQLIHPAQGGLIVRGHEFRPHPPHINRATLLLELGDQAFVQITAADNAGVGKAGGVQNVPGCDAELGQVARIEPDADHFMAVSPQPLPHLGGLPYPFQSVVGVHQKDAVIGHGLGIGLERFQIVIKDHHPAMRVRASDRNPEQLAGQHVRGRITAADIRGPAGCQTAVDALGAAQAELQDGFSAGRQADPSGFGRDQRLEVDQVEQRRLDKLALHQWSLDADQRLGWKNQRAFRDGIDLTTELHGLQGVKKRPVEQRFAVSTAHLGQKGRVVRIEPKMAQKIHHVFKAAGDAEASPKWIVAEEEIENGLPLGEP